MGIKFRIKRSVEGEGKWNGKLELRCIISMYQFLTSNINIMCHKQVLMKKSIKGNVMVDTLYQPKKFTNLTET